MEKYPQLLQSSNGKYYAYYVYDGLEWIITIWRVSGRGDICEGTTLWDSAEDCKDFFTSTYDVTIGDLIAAN